MKIIHIQWIDSHYGSGWVNPNDYISKRNTCKINTIGIYMGENKDDIYVALSIDENKYTQGYMAIPKGSIKKKTFLKEI